MRGTRRLMKMLSLVGALAFLFVFEEAAQAQTWIELSPVGSPPNPVFARKPAFYDAATNRMIVFFPGHPPFNGDPPGNGNEVWVLTGANGLGGTPEWIKLLPNGPPPISNADESVVYDQATNRLIVYGGCFSNCGFALSQVFVLTNANGLGGTPVWKQSTVTNPQARVGLSSVYDPVNNLNIAFGGHRAAFGTDQNDARILSNANGAASPSVWSSLATSGGPPSVRNSHTAFYDEENNRMTIFGGQNFISSCCPSVIDNYDDVWTLLHANGLGGTPTWEQLSPLGTPPAGRGLHSAVYDSVKNRMIVFGGSHWDQAAQLNVPLGDLWQLSNANGLGGTPVWTQLSQSGALPGPRHSHTAVFDPVNQRMIVLGGRDSADVPSNRIWVVSSCVPVSIPTSLTGTPGLSVTVPINVGDVTGRGIVSYDLLLSYDPALMQPQTPAHDAGGTLSNGMEIFTNVSVPGQITVSAFGITELAGSGTLLNLKFNLTGSAGSCSPLVLDSFLFNEGDPCATTSNGQMCIVSNSVAGKVNYCVAPTPRPVPGVQLEAAGTPPRSSTTDSSGNYQLNVLGAGPYTITPSKTGNANGISSFDASLVARHVAGSITLTSCQQAAGDASGDGGLSSFDAALIAQAVVGIPNPANKTGSWKFIPSNRFYAGLNANLTGQDYAAILVGEVSGNWIAAGTSGSSRIPPEVQISLPPGADSSAKGGVVNVLLLVTSVSKLGVMSYDFTLAYDPLKWEPQNQAVDASGTLSQAMTITAHSKIPGRLVVSGFGVKSLTGAGVLLKLRFKAAGTVDRNSTPTLENFVFNELGAASPHKTQE